MIKTNQEKKYTIEDFRVYIESQDSLGDVMYNLSEENIDKAIEKWLEMEEDQCRVSVEDYLEGVAEGIYIAEDGVGYFYNNDELVGNTTFEYAFDKTFIEQNGVTHIMFYGK